MPGMARRMVWKAELRLMAMMSFHLPAGIWAGGTAWWMPGLLPSTSMGDQAAMADIMASIWSGTRSSASKWRASGAPASRTACTAEAICPSLPRPLTATRAPCAASALAIARPMPEVLPVTSAVRPSRKRSFMAAGEWGPAATVAGAGAGSVVPKYDEAVRAGCYRSGMSHPMTIKKMCAAALAAGLVACAGGPRAGTVESTVFSAERSSEHRGQDDLLTAGLGLDGLRAMMPPAFADPARPTAAELRRRAVWSNWRGIADLAPGGGYGELYGSLAAVPGREFHAYATVPGATHPHRVMLQLPDAFDSGRRCVVVTASSGSRGIYGSIAVAGAWGLPKGCAVAYTDKGAGTDYFDLDAQTGAAPDGTLPAGVGAPLAFVPDAPADATGVAFRHAHPKDNPEADWGRHVRQAAEFALQALDQALPSAGPFTFDNTRVIAVGISNGGGAVLRAAELEGDWLDAVVAGEPNVYAGDASGARSLYDYTTQAALLMPCAQLHLQDLPQPPLTAQVAPLWAARCAALAAAGLVDGADTAAQAASAHERMLAAGWTDGALRAGVLSTGFDLWRAVAATYASAYGRYGVGEHPCGFA